MVSYSCDTPAMCTLCVLPALHVHIMSLASYPAGELDYEEAASQRAGRTGACGCGCGVGGVWGHHLPDRRSALRVVLLHTCRSSLLLPALSVCPFYLDQHASYMYMSCRWPPTLQVRWTVRRMDKHAAQQHQLQTHGQVSSGSHFTSSLPRPTEAPLAGRSRCLAFRRSYTCCPLIQLPTLECFGWETRRNPGICSGTQARLKTNAVATSS